MEIIIEEISRGHKLLSRHKLDQSRVSIGRGYQNDIILTDPHVCAKHLNLEFNGESWLAHDEDTVNGSYLEKNKQSVNQHTINSGDIISLGKSQIRILFPDHPVEESLAFSPFESLINFMRHPTMLLTSISLFSLVAGIVFYLNKPVEVTFTQLLVPAIGMTMLFALWPLLIALISHLTKNDARVWNQLGVCFAFFNLMWLSDVIESVLDFNLSANWPIAGLITLLPIGLAFVLFWLNCYIGFHMTAGRRLTIAASLTTLLFGGSYLIQLSNKPDFSINPQYNATIMTPGFLFSPSSDVDSFIDDSRRLFGKAQKAAAEK
ncbi:FHA domain-containing protein [Thalassomonas actiniarum]|uniref:FHA domain-containing protein n=1 Tax=Thalassomonas actiniarum TaxID=485447 RepID=A0AAE9YRG6_9GAMM|nr:FHA domain-containing protein [Thalassomonas actiniarum]WDD99720.1 FHA domain-containing protein [Thalassomonas actiniarum]